MSKYFTIFFSITTFYKRNKPVKCMIVQILKEIKVLNWHLTFWGPSPSPSSPGWPLWSDKWPWKGTPQNWTEGEVHLFWAAPKDSAPLLAWDITTRLLHHLSHQILIKRFYLYMTNTPLLKIIINEKRPRSDRF